LIRVFRIGVHGQCCGTGDLPYSTRKFAKDEGVRGRNVLAKQHVYLVKVKIEGRVVFSIASLCRAEDSGQIRPGRAIHGSILHSEYGQLVGCASSSRIVEKKINVFPSKIWPSGGLIE
jgi:hypothetical protein